jgi:uncharacterized protein YpmS
MAQRKALSRWWLWVAVLLLALVVLLLVSFCAQFADIERGDATHIPNSTILVIGDSSIDLG